MKILLAEDDLVFQLMLRKALSKWGYELVIVSDGEQAWEELRSNTGPRLAILDWVMPLADGLEVCRRVRQGQLAHYVYIILLTGKANATDLVAGLEAGADDYLAKPVNLSELNLRLRAGSRMLEFEEQYRVIAETASDGIVAMEGKDRIYFANEAAGAMFGYSSSELVGQSFSLLAPGFDEPPVGKKKTSSRLEIIGKHRNGSDMILEISLSESFDDRHQRLTAMIRDVTGKRLLEQQLAQAQKLESIGRLAAGVAHEINTPIQYIGDNGRFLDDAFRDLMKVVEPHRAVARLSNGTDRAAGETVLVADADVDIDYLRGEIPLAIGQLLEGVEQVARIVRGMKEFSHPGMIERTDVNINHAIANTILVSRNEWKYVADVTTDFDENLPTVPCQAGELNQVMLNLLVNAAHAIGDVVKDSGIKGLIKIMTHQVSGWAEIRVSDTGCGIPKDIQTKIFDPFFTTKEVGKGTGQGLALAHSVVVQKHGGTIDVDSQVGIGTSFIIRLPLKCDPPQSIVE